MNVIKNILGEHGYAKRYQKNAHKYREVAHNPPPTGPLTISPVRPGLRPPAVLPISKPPYPRFGPPPTGSLYANVYQRGTQKYRKFKDWHSVGTWNYKDDKDMEQKRLDAAKYFGVDTRITKIGNKFNIYAWGEDLELDKKIDWGSRHYK